MEERENFAAQASPISSPSPVGLQKKRVCQVRVLPTTLGRDPLDQRTTAPRLRYRPLHPEEKARDRDEVTQPCAAQFPEPYWPSHF